MKKNRLAYLHLPINPIHQVPCRYILTSDILAEQRQTRKPGHMLPIGFFSIGA